MNALQSLTWKHMPDPFWRSVTKAAFVARREAWDHCRAEFADPEAQDLLGLYCRQKLEGHLRGVAERFQLESEPVQASGQRWYHTEVRSGPVVLTAATVPTPCAMVAPAEYRKGLAEGAGQHLFTLGQAPRGRPCLLCAPTSQSVQRRHTRRPQGERSFAGFGVRSVAGR